MANQPQTLQELPYRAEYAKSGRAKCRNCKKTINKDELRLAIMVKSRFFEGMGETWYHFDCFFARARPKSVTEVGRIENLKPEDQKRIEAKIAEVAIDGKSPEKVTTKKVGTVAPEFLIQYAKSSRSTCPACSKSISKDEIRIGTKEYGTAISARFGAIFRWYHVDCFARVREDLDFLAPGRTLPGFKELLEEDQKLIESKLPEIKEKRKIPEDTEVAAKKAKTEEENKENVEMFQRQEMEPAKHLEVVIEGAVVDPESGLEGQGHVYHEGNQVYASILSKVDHEAGENKFYKLQLIESDKEEKKYWVFRSWGRLGRIGEHKIEEMESKEAALELFQKLFEENTGNKFDQPFLKKPGFYLPMDVDYGEGKESPKLEPDPEGCKQEIPVQKLICKMFDAEPMQRSLLELEIDLEKMPLAKLNRGQITEAYKILKEATELLAAEAEEMRIQDVTNRFFTLIPHNFGTYKPPLLNDMKLIKKKLELLEYMKGIEVTYDMLQRAKEEGGSIIEALYKDLKCNMSTLEHDSEMWETIKKYMTNTHTDETYTLELEEVFRVEHEGDKERYEKFRSLHNRKLLWHVGSRTSNLAGILSKGLRKPPEEAPVSGYMFGKGIYFSDMVSKAANYCCANPGLLLLCEVALGDMYELTEGKDLLKPPEGKQSVKGVGTTEPDPAEFLELPTGVVVPYGKPVMSRVEDSPLMYNEYVVYEEAQVKMLYLVEFKFKFRRPR